MSTKKHSKADIYSSAGGTKPIVSGCFSVGMKIPMIDGSYLKIMAFVDGYYMARYKGCVPFCCRQDELIRKMLARNSR